MILELTTKEQTFINAYFEAIDFTETGDIDQPESGTELDEDFKRESIIDCLCFYSQAVCYLPTDQEAQAGHDFWLTRNGHGTGFWDRPEIYKNAELLTAKAQKFGEAYPYFKEV